MRLIKDIELYNSIIDDLNVTLQHSSYDYDIISLLSGTDAIIFGGAVRDSIAEMPINDIDIIALSYSHAVIRDRVHLTLAQNAEEYAKINLPGTHYFTVWEDNAQTIQVITPSTLPIKCNETDATNYLIDIISNVDLSNCGVAIMPQKYPGYIFETVHDALRDIKNKEYRITNGHMTNARLGSRKDKMNRRGWKNRFEETPIRIDFSSNQLRVFVHASFDHLFEEDKYTTYNHIVGLSLAGKIDYFKE